MKRFKTKTTSCNRTNPFSKTITVTKPIKLLYAQHATVHAVFASFSITFNSLSLRTRPNSENNQLVLMSCLLTLFFLAPFFSKIHSNVFEINFSSWKCPSVYFSFSTDWKIVKLVTWHISSFSFFLSFFFLLLGAPTPRARRVPTCSLTLCEWSVRADAPDTNPDMTQQFNFVLRLLTSINEGVTSLQVTQLTA